MCTVCACVSLVPFYLFFVFFFFFFNDTATTEIYTLSLHDALPISNNAAIDHLRRKSIDTLSLDGAPSAETPEQQRATSLQVGDRAESPLDEVENRELGTAIERA